MYEQQIYINTKHFMIENINEQWKNEIKLCEVAELEKS